MNQREAVYNATMGVLADDNVAFDDGQAGGVEAVITKEQRLNVLTIVTTSILTGQTEMSAEAKVKYADEKACRGYVSGLISNWFRKDPRLNGNVKHAAKNPGSRFGATDDQVKALKALRVAKAEDSEAVSAIDAALARRQAELSAAKVSKVVVNLDAIPADLRAKLGL